ncbi:MAG: NAD-dependent epimerase/dehydratase family protein [Bacteroidetes bacterium]|nr:NAD-dependent epimerase/dehydratase family protein [Bacteroidota bacterium]
MKVIITGATGMVGEGVLLECLDNPVVEQVLMVNRRTYDLKHPKLKELIVKDFFKLEDVTDALNGYDACFYCAGISSVGMKEEEYRHITYDTTLYFAKKLADINPAMTFIFVSGAATDSSEKGKIMWARVKGKTENDLMKLPFKQQFNFRPGIMKPTKGQKNVKTSFRILIPLLAPFFPRTTSTLKDVAIAMIHAALKGYSKQVVEVADMKLLAKM